MSRVRSKYTKPEYHFTCFTVGGYDCCISLKSVREITSVAMIREHDSGHDFVHGVMPLRSVHIPVVDMRRRLDVEPASTGPGMVIVVAVADRVVGLVVDSVTGVVNAGKEIRPMRSGLGSTPFDAFVDVVLETNSGVTRVISIESLFTEEEITLLSGGIPGTSNTAHGW